MLLRFQAFQLQWGLYFQETKDRSNSSQGSLKRLFFLRNPRLPDRGQMFFVAFGRNCSISTAINSSCQHHQAHDSTHHPGDDDGGDGVAQADGPWLGLGLAAGTATVPKLTVVAVLQWAPVLEAVVVAAGQVHVSCPQRTGPKELVGNFEEVLPLPNPWCWADNAIAYSSWKKKNCLNIWQFQNYFSVKLTFAWSKSIISFNFILLKICNCILKAFGQLGQWWDYYTSKLT